MKKILKQFNIIIITFLLFSNLAFGYTSPAISQIARIENSIWGFEYKKDDAAKRLSRIENNVFGQTNTNLSSENRIKKINEALGFESWEDSKKESWELATQEAPDINYPQIDLLELQIFNQKYDSENIYKRIERLEKKIFGSNQSGDLASRTDRLKAFIKKDVIAQKPNYHIEQPYQPTDDIEKYMGSQKKYEDNEINIQISGLEYVIFNKTYSQDPVGLRLNRLERKIFQRDFSSDDDTLRMQRLQAAANAQKTAKYYEANKIQKFTSTGLQIGSIILMILALIL